MPLPALLKAKPPLITFDNRVLLAVPPIVELAAIATVPVFRGHQGMLAVELWNAENKALRGTIAPVFYTAAGEMLNLPDRFVEAIRKITGAVACLGCKHTHIAEGPGSNIGWLITLKNS